MDGWKPVNDEGSLTDRIVNQGELMINNDRLRPGDRLPAERDMAALLRVSRPSLREAVRVLEARGRLDVRHGQGVFISQPRSERQLRQALSDSDTSLDELFAMRSVLEAPAAEWAAQKITSGQLRQLRGILDDMSRLIDGSRDIDFTRLADLDVEFHMSIALAAGNRFLHRTSAVLNDLIRSGMATTLTIPGRAEASRRDHQRIYQALADRDTAAARRAAKAHIKAAHASAIKRSAETEPERATG